MIEAFLITGSGQEKRSLIAVGLNNVDAMCCNPNIRLFKARLESGFRLTHMFSGEQDGPILKKEITPAAGSASVFGFGSADNDARDRG